MSVISGGMPDRNIYESYYKNQPNINKEKEKEKTPDVTKDKGPAENKAKDNDLSYHDKKAWTSTDDPFFDPFMELARGGCNPPKLSKIDSDILA
jgi:hypothetical protein